MAKKKLVYLELIRAIAIYLILFHHTGTIGCFLFTVRENSPFYPVYMFLSVTSKISVPLFWMVSGSLLLPKEESIRYVYRHRVLRMAIVIVLFSFFYYMFTIYKGLDRFDLAYFLTGLYTNQHAFANWFFYSYIGMLMMLPFLRKLVKSMTGNQLIYLFFLILIMKGVIPILQYLVSTIPAVKAATGNNALIMNGFVKANLFSENVFYFIGGYYFGCYLKNDDLSRKHAFAWAGAGILAIIITCLMTQYLINVTGVVEEDTSETFYNNLIAIPAFAIFYCIRLLFYRRSVPAAVEKIIVFFGSSAFGIMLCEQALRMQLEPYYYFYFKPVLPRMLACLGWVTMVYFLGLLITAGLKLIPGIRKLI